jgi:hypothetical protein
VSGEVSENTDASAARTDSTGNIASTGLTDPLGAGILKAMERGLKNEGRKLTGDLLKNGKIVICQGCKDCIREMDEYVWDLGSEARDRVKKENDHAMDDMRYFAATVLGRKTDGFVACAVQRRR